MAQPREYSGNKMSLRSSAGDQIHRIESISGNLGSIGDTLVSTNKSIILSIAVLALPNIIMIFIFMYGSGIKNLKNTWIPILMVVIGSILMFLNVFFVNPSRGSQLIVSFDYWRKLIAENHERELIKHTPYRFARQDASRASLESVYKGHKRYTAVIKVHGAVSQTSFDDDLTQLTVINRNSLRALERTTVRTTINVIGKPKIENKNLSPNATPGMEQRLSEITRTVKNIRNAQTLDTYLMIDSPTWTELQKKVNNQIVFFRQGLVVTAQVLAGDELKQTIYDLFT